MPTPDRLSGNYTALDVEADGFCYFETVLVDLIGYTLEQIRKNSTIIDKLFKRLSSKQREELRNYLVANPNIMLSTNWPRKNQSVPYIALVCAGGGETNQMLGDFAGEGSYDSIGIETYEIRESNMLDVYVGTEDALATWFLTNLVRFIIYTNKFRLEAKQGVANIVVNTAQDIMFDPSYMPTEVYIKKLRVNYEAYCDWSTEVEKIIDYNACVTSS